MALKPDRVESYTDISFFMNTTGERGGVVVHDTTGVGASMDDAGAVVGYPNGTDLSGLEPAGVLLNDVVNYDLTRQHLNWHRDEVQVGNKVTLLRQGQVTTNVVDPDVAPAAGERAYFDAFGRFSNADVAGSTQVGRFLSGLDSDGYVKVDINIT
jgi:hypothetical protein